MRSQGEANARRITDLEAQNRVLSEQLANARVAPPRDNGRRTTAPLTDEERESLEPATLRALDSFDEVMRQYVDTAVGDVRRETAQTATDIRSTEQQRAKSAFLRELTRLSPHWRTYNTDPGFEAWLQQPFTELEPERLMVDLFDQNVEENNADAVARYFNAYIKEVEDYNGSAGGAGADGGQPPAEAFSDVMPDTAGRGARSVDIDADPARKPIFSDVGIGKFYDDVRRGKFKGREAHVQRMEQEILTARREGRITRGNPRPGARPRRPMHAM